MNGAGLYYRNPDDMLIERELDGLTLVYHKPSGLTHIVDSPVPEILTALEECPQSAWSLLERLLDRYDLEQDTGALTSLEEHLAVLSALGLVRIHHAA